MEKILVTGGAGFIGSHTCEELLRLGYTVVAVDNFNNYYDPKVKEKNVSGMLDNPNFKLYRVDITDMGELKKVFEAEKFDKVIHLAARAGVRPSLKNPELYHKVNIDGTTNLLELTKENGIKHFVFASSSSVYGVNKKIPFSEDDPIVNTISPYAETKKNGEKLCREYHDKFGINIICLRFFTVYGTRGRPDMAPYMFTKRIMNGEAITKYGDGLTKRDYTYVSDIVFGVIKSLDVEGFEILNLGDNNPITLNEFIVIIENVIGKKAKINQAEMQPGDVPITYADISKAEKILGYKPKVKIEEGMKRLFEWMQE